MRMQYSFIINISLFRASCYETSQTGSLLLKSDAVPTIQFPSPISIATEPLVPNTSPSKKVIWYIQIHLWQFIEEIYKSPRNNLDHQD